MLGNSLLVRNLARKCAWSTTKMSACVVTRNYAKLLNKNITKSSGKKGKLKDDNDLEFFRRFVKDSKTGPKVLNEKNINIESTPTEADLQENGNSNEESPKSSSKRLDWYIALQNGIKESNIDKISDIRSQLYVFTMEPKVKQLSSDFMSSLSPYLENFGSQVLADTLQKDPQYSIIYQKNPNMAYLLAAASYFEGLETAQVIDSRMAIRREAIPDNLLYEQFHDELHNYEREKRKFKKASISSVVKAFLSLPELPFLYLPSYDLEAFLHFLVESEEEVDPEILATLYSNLMECGIPMTPDESIQFLWAKLKLLRTFDISAYEILRMGPRPPDDRRLCEQYNLFFECALNYGDLNLFSRIMKDMDDEDLQPNRKTFRLFSEYFTATKDLTNFLNLWKLRVENYRLILTAEDYTSLITGLLKMDDTEAVSFASDVFFYLDLIRKTYRNVYKDDIKSQHLVGALEMDNSRILPGNILMDIYDLCVSEQEIIMIYPHISQEIYDSFIESCDTISQLQEWILKMDQEHIPQTAKSFSLIIEKLHEKRQILRFEVFKKIIFDLLSNGDTALHMILISKNLRLFTEMCEMYVQSGDLKSESILSSFESVKALLPQLESYEQIGIANLGTGKKNMVELSAKLFKAIMNLVKPNDA